MKNYKVKYDYANCGASAESLLQIAFIVLKLCKVINWSWWWVMAPTWITLGLVVIVILVVFLIEFICDLKGRMHKK